MTIVDEEPKQYLLDVYYGSYPLGELFTTDKIINVKKKGCEW